MLFQRWKDMTVSHALTVVFFCRVFYEKDQFVGDVHPEMLDASNSWFIFTDRIISMTISN